MRKAAINTSTTSQTFLNTPPRAESVVDRPALNMVATIMMTRAALNNMPIRASAVSMIILL
jgi:hypothetical protein